jgi:hypothetical protein
MKPVLLLLLFLLLYGCTSEQGKPLPGGIKTTSNPLDNKVITDSTAEFERRIYFNIDEIVSGKVYTNKDKIDVFYRVLVIPEEENIMLIAEDISVGEEGGGFKLVKLSRITDEHSALPRFGLYSADSLKFIDSVRVQGYFNKQKKIINLDKLKSYHVSY